MTLLKSVRVNQDLEYLKKQKDAKGRKLEIIEIESYTENEKLHIAKEHLLAKQLEKNGLKKEQLSFTFEGVHYCFYLDKVKIYAQCYAAIANRMGDMNRLRCVDLGSWTMDVLSVKDKVPMDKDAYTYEVGLITAIERIKKDGLPKVHCEIPEEDITDYIRGNVTGVNAEFIPIIEKGLQEYADSVEAKLREIKVDLKHENIVYVGGGASVMKKYGRTKGMNIQYVTDVKANAIGYRYLADNIG